MSFFKASIHAADPKKALRLVVGNSFNPAPEGGRLILIAAGKAAIPMMQEALTLIPKEQKVTALAITNYENSAEIEGASVHVAGHPVPDENGLICAERVISLLKTSTQNDHVIVLLSGGASALLPAPVEQITFYDKIELNRILLKSEVDIVGLNMVRQQVSRLKGGGMTRLASPSKLTAYILSDVIGDDIRVIGSGPTVKPIGSCTDAFNLLHSLKLKDKIPNSILQYLSEDRPKPNTAKNPDTPQAINNLIGSNKLSIEAALKCAHENGWNAEIVSDTLIGDVQEAANLIIQAINQCPKGQKNCLIFGGETFVNVTGSGKGGRNQELSLRVAMALDDNFAWAFLSGGTDGRDGPTDAAGGLVDSKSSKRLKSSNINCVETLQNSDSYSALQASGDLIKIGSTGTNVADVQIALIP